MTFERLEERVRRAAERRARAKAAELAERVGAELPPGIRAHAVEEGVRLTGRALRRRVALEPELRWLVEKMR